MGGETDFVQLHNNKLWEPRPCDGGWACWPLFSRCRSLAATSRHPNGILVTFTLLVPGQVQAKFAASQAAQDQLASYFLNWGRLAGSVQPVVIVGMPSQLDIGMLLPMSLLYGKDEKVAADAIVAEINSPRGFAILPKSKYGRVTVRQPARESAITGMWTYITSAKGGIACGQFKGRDKARAIDSVKKNLRQFGVKGGIGYLDVLVAGAQAPGACNFQTLYRVNGPDVLAALSLRNALLSPAPPQLFSFGPPPGLLYGSGYMGAAVVVLGSPLS